MLRAYLSKKEETYKFSVLYGSLRANAQQLLATVSAVLAKACFVSASSLLRLCFGNAFRQPARHPKHTNRREEAVVQKYRCTLIARKHDKSTAKNTRNVPLYSKKKNTMFEPPLPTTLIPCLPGTQPNL